MAIDSCNILFLGPLQYDPIDIDPKYIQRANLLLVVLNRTSCRLLPSYKSQVLAVLLCRRGVSQRIDLTVFSVAGI